MLELGAWSFINTAIRPLRFALAHLLNGWTALPGLMTAESGILQYYHLLSQATQGMISPGFWISCISAASLDRER
jgi:hypothetical protein